MSRSRGASSKKGSGRRLGSRWRNKSSVTRESKVEMALTRWKFYLDKQDSGSLMGL
jgi:hypothetical protein